MSPEAPSQRVGERGEPPRERHADRKRVWPPRRLAVGSLAAVLLLATLGFVPLFAGPGYEIALAAGLILPALAAAVVGAELAQRPRDPFDALCLAFAWATVLLVLGYLTTLGHGLGRGFCSFWQGTWLFALGPGVGALLGAVWGAVAAELSRALGAARRRKGLAVVLAVAGPLGCVATELALFYLTPMVFAFDPFVGYFSGTLYDTVLDPTGLVTYRAASACTLLACYVASLHLERDPGGRLQRRRLGRPGLAAVGLLAATASIASVASGPALGHWQTASSIRRTLGGASRVGRCEVIHDRAIDRDEVARLGRDCDGHLAALAEWFERPPPAEVTVYLFADAGQKRALMGAASTSIAKPWRREIYIQLAGYPHPHLGHELAHVVAGELGQGPFRIAGSLGGWLPDPGRIEGVAVASQASDSELGDREWAKAMRDIGVLPPLDGLFALGFLGSHASTAYTAAGAFVAFVRERFGAAVVARWYGGEALERLTGQSLVGLEGQWHGWLDELTLDDQAIAQARARFDRPSVFARRCPHKVDELLSAAGGAEGRGDYAGAIADYAQALGLDPSNERASLGRAGCLDGAGQTARALDALQTMVGAESFSRAGRDRALERLADLALREGDCGDALPRYADVRSRVLDEDRLRNLDVKELACHDPVARPALVALLVGTDRRGPDMLEAIARLGAWRAADPADGLPAYLLARRYFDAGRFDRAATELDAALDNELRLARVRTEALRLRLVVGCALGDHSRARAALAAYRAEPGVAATRIEWAQALYRRCAR